MTDLAAFDAVFTARYPAIRPRIDLFDESRDGFEIFGVALKDQNLRNAVVSREHLKLELFADMLADWACEVEAGR